MRAYHAERAAGWFPLDPRIRTAPAHLYSAERWEGSRTAAIAALRAAIAVDPLAVDMRRNLAAYLIENGERAAAEAEIAVVSALSPRSAIVLRVNVNPKTGGALQQ